MHSRLVIIKTQKAELILLITSLLFQEKKDGDDEGGGKQEVSDGHPLLRSLTGEEVTCVEVTQTGESQSLRMADVGHVSAVGLSEEK